MAKKLTVEQRQHLLDVYHRHGMQRARELAPQYGVSPNYVVKKLVRVHGVKVRRRGPATELQRQPWKPFDKDPRWAKARAIGLVVV